MDKTLKIFSYLPNPRVWKAVIAGNICGVKVEVIGDKPKELGKWLWDTSQRRGDDTRQPSCEVRKERVFGCAI